MPLNPAYRKWIDENVNNLVVLDLSFQPEGLYSLLASSQGASKVYNVQKDLSVWMRVHKVFQRNDPSILTFFLRDLRALKLPSDVDVIITDHANAHFLKKITVLSDILWIRDVYLNKDKGFMIPHRFSLHLCAISDSDHRESHVNVWEKQQIFGFDLSPMMQKALREVTYRNVHHQQVISNSVQVLDVNLMTMKPSDMEEAFLFNWTLSFFHESVLDSLLFHFVVVGTTQEHHQSHVLEISPRHPSSLGCPIMLLEKPYQVFPSDELSGRIELRLENGSSKVCVQLEHTKEISYHVV